MSTNSRAIITRILCGVIHHGNTLEDAFQKFIPEDCKDQAFIKASSYGCCRWYFQLNAITQKLLSKPLKTKDQDIYCLILQGIFQLLHSDVAEHAAVSETVNTVKALKKIWARGLVNACLRNFLRQKDTLLTEITHDDATHYAHPIWLIHQLKNAWPEDWQAILEANNTQAPMTIRANLVSTELLEGKILDTPGKQHCIQLSQATDVTHIPGFNEGKVSIQDQASQCVAPILQLENNMSVLDACAAPGGKTGHILEIAPDIQLTALDISSARLNKVRENLQRLKLGADTNYIACDANNTKTWWDGKPFDRILLDGPCSGTGVIRRHPDIKLLRREEDITGFQQQQLALLNSLWPLLVPGGKLLYTTCSILPAENEEVIANFLASQPNASTEAITLPIGQAQKHGWQCFPQMNGHDGFYYCLILKD